MFLMEGDEGEELALKPMNCPGHCTIFGSRKRSYRELPIRYAEFSRLHRNERSGTLTGLSRVRSMAQDDAHIYCTPEQVDEEMARFFEMTGEIYRALGLECTEVAVSTRPEGFIGESADWARAEQALIASVRKAGFDPRVKPGEAAFYGPKVECDFRDVMGRAWTLATVQIDVAMPERFGLCYVGSDDELHRPAMLHRAILGSLERFIALYIEMTGGDFPMWLAPVQVALLPITERHLGYARSVAERLDAAGIRTVVDDRNEKLGFKIREAEVQKIPLMLVMGDLEQETGSVTPRWRHGTSRDGGALPADDLVAGLAEDLRERRAPRLARGG
jgi:threonyl-tRNA synthetase